jgi:hypothetical protein
VNTKSFSLEKFLVFQNRMKLFVKSCLQGRLLALVLLALICDFALPYRFSKAWWRISLKKSRLVAKVVLSILCIILIAFPSFQNLNRISFVSYGINSISNNSTYAVRGQAAVSIFEVENSPVPVVIYSVSNFAIDNSSVPFYEISGAPSGTSGGSVEANASIYTTEITLASGTLSGLANITLLGSNQVVVQSPPQLMSVAFIQNGNYEGIWNGYLGSNGNVSGFAYYNPNESGELVLQYENYTSTANVVINIEPKMNSYTVPVDGLQRVQVTNVSGGPDENSTTATTEKFQLQSPERFAIGGAGFELTASPPPFRIDPIGMNSTLGYFNGTAVPAIQWNLKGYGAFLPPQRNINSPDVSFNATVWGLYGINGTSLGFVDNSFGNSSSSIGGGASGESQTEMSITVIACSNTPNYVSNGSVVSSNLQVGNSSVLVFYGTNGTIESNANVTSVHNVFLNGSMGSLLRIQANSETNFAVIFSNNSTGYVNTVSPINVTNSTFDLNGINHVAQKITLANDSGYMIFNVPLSQNVTNAASLAVYKETPNGLTKLDPQNYYLSSGELVIFDDPSATYYIVYPDSLGGLLAFSPANEIALVLLTILIIAMGIYFIKRGIRRPAHEMISF